MRISSWMVVALSGLLSGACGEANSNKAAPGSAGSPSGSSTTGGSASGGSASAGSGSGSGSGSAGSGEDEPHQEPLAVEPDLTGLVATSDQWLLVSEADSVAVSASLDFVDLESNTHHPLDSANLPVAYGYWSPDQKSFIFSGANGDSDRNLTIVRLTKNGYVPAKLIDGFEGTRGSFALPHWDETSRFFTVARGGSMTDGIEVVDSVLGKRLGHIDFPPSFSHSFAPKGLYFGYLQGDVTMYASGIARVVKDGISAPTELPNGAYMPLFSSDGRRVFFGQKAGELTEQYYLDLPDPTPKPLTIIAEGETLNGSASPGPSADSVLAYVAKSDADRQYVQAFVDGRPRVVLSDTAKKVRFALEGGDHNLVAVDYETSLDIVRVEPYVRLPLPGLTVKDPQQYWTTGVIGQHVYHQVDGRLYVASISVAGALTDTAISAPGEQVSVCTFYISHVPTTKLAYRTVGAQGAEVVVVDLTASPPAVAARVTSSAADNRLYCPDFSLDESAMVVAEVGENLGKIYGVKWTDGTASEPELLLESDRPLQVRAFSL